MSLFSFGSKKQPVKGQVPPPTGPNPALRQPNLPQIKKVPLNPTQVKNKAQELARGMVAVKDLIAPASVEVDFDYLKIGNIFYRTLFVAGYPRFVSANWLSPLLSFDHALTVSMFVYPTESKIILEDLKRKIAEMEATIESDIERGKVVDPIVQTSLDDALGLQAQLAKGAERFFQFSLYITIPAMSVEELNRTSREVESTLGSILLISRHASLQMEEGFKSTLPYCQDSLNIQRNMDTTSLGTTFPFTTASLTSNQGVLYGINEHDGSLVVFDRFSLENANCVVLGKSGVGKSFLVKLEAMRQLLFGTEVFILDPEGEYKEITNTLNGEYIEFSYNAPIKINPFDLAGVTTEGENELGLKILSLHSLLRVVMGQLDSTEDALLDRALVATYKQKGITPDPQTQTKEPPLMEDLYKALLGMEDPNAQKLASRLEKFVKGSLAGIFNQQSNLDIKNPFTVFCIKDLESELRPIAMFIILDFIWTKVKRQLKKRVLIVDEAWYLMRQGDSANFLYSVAKRARKYYLGLTTITQDVEDFLNTDHGKAIITNSSIQILLKQSPAAIDKVAEVFYLSGGEKHFLLSSDVGEGLFFAGPSHVALRIVASPEEYELVTSKPQEIVRKQAQESYETANPIISPTPPPPPPLTQNPIPPNPFTPPLTQAEPQTTPPNPVIPQPIQQSPSLDIAQALRERQMGRNQEPSSNFNQNFQPGTK